MLGLSFLFGCATATPSSKSQVSKACNNTVSVTIALVVPTNAVGDVEIQPGGVSITLSDLIGTQVQSADAGRDDTTGQSAAPANTSGLNGDKAIEGVADTVQAGLTGGGSTILQKGKAALSGGDTAASAATGADTVTVTPPAGRKILPAVPE